jgi:outer membrane biosynthesis protein TonB
VHRSGSAPLDRAAIGAVRPWRFEPVQGIARDKPISGLVRIGFAPPQRRLGAPILILP